MNINIEIRNMKLNFFTKNIKESEIKNKIIKQYVTKIKQYCFYSINEANISDKIKKIPYYINNYSIVEDYDFLTISQINENHFEKINIEKNKKYLVFKYFNERFVSFNDYLLNLPNPKLFVFHIIESFSYILNSLIILNHNNICFLNLSPKNIVFNLDCGEKPIIHNFDLSLQINKLNESYISNIITKIDDFTHKPLEFHILFYLIKNDLNTISYSFIEEICEIYTKNLSILQLFSESYKASYKSVCIQSLKKYINISKKDIINDILEQHEKWDIFSLSLLYLHIFGHFTKVFTLKGTFINKIVLELSKNIHPNPLRRSSLSTLLEKYNILFNNELNWSYINTLPLENMSLLFDILEN
jgi:hypothetical protein